MQGDFTKQYSYAHGRLFFVYAAQDLRHHRLACGRIFWPEQLRRQNRERITMHPLILLQPLYGVIIQLTVKNLVQHLPENRLPADQIK